MALVLVVDDEEPIRRILSRWISDAGHEIVDAPTAEDALDRMAERAAAVAFCDVQMPGQGGVWLTKQIRTRYHNSAVVLATGERAIPPATSMQAGVMAYIVKPFTRKAILDALVTALEWHDKTVASGPRPEDGPERVQAWLDSLD